MMSIIGSVLGVALQLVAYFVDKNSQDKKMQELFYQFVERFGQGEYLKSAKLQQAAQARLAALASKPFIETP